MPLLRGALHETGDARALLGADERPHLDALLFLRAHLDAAGGARQIRDQLVVDLRAGVDAAGGRAILARRCRNRKCARRSTTDSRSASSNTMTGALPPSSRCVRLVPFDRGREHLLAARDRAGQRDHRDLGLRDQRRADGVAAAADHVDDAGRKQLRADRRELERGERRLLRGLEHHGVAGGERRAPSSRPPSSVDSSTARSRRRRRSDRGGSCW